jgi:translation initiation factor IF-2
MSINVTDLARRLGVPSKELLEKLPQLGFSLGRHAIKVNDKEAADISRAWAEMKRRETLQRKHREAEEREKRRIERQERTKDKAIELPAVMTVREFAERLEMPLTSVMQELMRAGVFAAMNERIDFDTAVIVASDLGFNVTNANTVQEPVAEMGNDRVAQALADDTETAHRAPVVVVMGHVDHGKTSLLDAIRSTNVVDKESGGITQHIGAYQVQRKGQELTFIDTPGHEAFTVMRSRGAKVADLAILVVAADDGVQPQTKEAIDIIRAAELPFIVAINKIDKPEANVERAKRELSERNVLAEDWGGKTIMVPISAKKGTGLDDLLDALILVYDVQKDEIVANPHRPAVGTIIESHIDKGAGPVATVLIQGGTLRGGDTLGVNGAFYGRVRAMRDYTGASVKEAGPSVPVQVLGWKVAPVVGDVLEVGEEANLQKTAKSKMKGASLQMVGPAPATLPSASDEKKLLNIILKADVLGSMEAILGMFEKIQHERVGVSVIAKSLGNVTEADVARAEASSAVILAFSTGLQPGVEALARNKQVSILSFDIIYRLFDAVVARLQELLGAETVRVDLGKAEVLALFKKLENGQVVGARVVEGKMESPAKVRIWRGEELIGEGTVKEIRSGKEVVREVRKGEEAGVSYTGKTKIEVGDSLEFFKEEVRQETLVVETTTKKR